MADPVLSSPFDAPNGLLKARYASPKKRRWARDSIHKARGFIRQTVKGRTPTYRPAKRGA